MKKRQFKKQRNKFINGTQRYGCEYCHGINNIFFKTNDGWLDVSLGIDKKQKRITISQDHVPVGYVEARYCWFCGRKLKR